MLHVDLLRDWISPEQKRYKAAQNRGTTEIPDPYLDILPTYVHAEGRVRQSPISPDAPPEPTIEELDFQRAQSDAILKKMDEARATVEERRQAQNAPSRDEVARREAADTKAQETDSSLGGATRRKSRKT